MSSKYLTLEISNYLAVITLRRPEKKNALNSEMYEGITQMLNDVSQRDDVKITAITGTGDFFTSGNDLMSAFMSADNLEKALDVACERVRRFVEAFIRHKKILIAVVNGPAVGIGVTILPLCDIVFCTSNAWFVTPFTKLGICAEACSSYTFPLIFGTSKANSLLLFNEKLSAEEAWKYGLVARVLQPQALETEVWIPLRNFASQLSGQSLLASKQLMRRFVEDKLHAANLRECAELRRLFVTDEAKEAVLNFVSRRSHL